MFPEEFKMWMLDIFASHTDNKLKVKSAATNSCQVLSTTDNYTLRTKICSHTTTAVLSLFWVELIAKHLVMAVGSASTIIGISDQPSLQELCSVNATHQPLLTAQHRLWEWDIFPSTTTLHGGHCEVTVVMITSRWTVVNIIRPWEQNQEVQTNSCERHLRPRTKGEKG